ncbi:host attachment protein [Sedimentimonas flavescens]|uniref:baeRF12 domain-containing protein n=1 Tax=Sedimentimonas flavescens TaxID=2851012 RepID=UPI001C4A04AE|nr:host attachment family protein [Sedimentimonas flavescens]MBW0157413.1 host attachment family protein [Sedimentimonas flavescens]
MLLSKGIWVVVADSEKALVLRNEGTGREPRLAFVRREEAPEVIVASDAPGRRADVGQGQRSAMEVPDYSRLNAETFMADLADDLARAQRRGAFDKLILVAPPQVLGALRAALSEGLAAHVVAEIDKTLTKHPLPEIGKIVASDIDAL